MPDESTISSRLSWIASIFHPDRKIAGATIAALRALLRSRHSTPAPATPASLPAQTVRVRLAEVPDLGEVGGIARVEAGAGGAIGVARVGRNSFVGYRLTGEELEEVPVDVDETAGELHIASTPGGRLSRAAS